MEDLARIGTRTRVALALTAALLLLLAVGAPGAAAGGDEDLGKSLVEITVPDRVELDRLVALDVDLAEYLRKNDDGTLTVAVVAFDDELAAIKGAGFELGRVIEDESTWLERVAERRQALTAEDKAHDLAEDGRTLASRKTSSRKTSSRKTASRRLATVGDVTVMRADYFTNYAGRFLSVEARTSLGTPTGGPTMAVAWKPADADYGAATTMGKFTDTDPNPDVYMYHRQLIRIGAVGTTDPVPTSVRVASSTGAVEEFAVKPWLAGGLPPYADGFLMDFNTAYVDPTQGYAKINALATEFSNIAEVIDLPHKTAGYQRRAMAIMNGTGAIGTAPSATASAVVLWSKAWGHEGGEQIRAQFRNPGAANSPLSVTVGPGSTFGFTDIVVSLGTSSTGALASTAAQVVAAINANPAASALVTATPWATSTGTGIVAARALVALDDFLNAPSSVKRGSFQPQVLRIGKHRDGSKVGVFLYCQQHAREWATALTCVETAERLVRNYATDPLTKDIVDNLDIFIIPSVNPDGGHLSMYDFASQRRNMVNYCSPTSASSMPSGRNTWGVDLNRNNTIGSLFDGFIGASSTCTSDTYAGPSEASEAEIKNEMWVVDTFANIKFANNIHSYGGYFMWSPGAYTLNRTTLAAANIGVEGYFFEAGDRILKRIKEIRDTVILPQRTGPIADVLYSAAGNSADDQWYRKGIISYSFETGADRFQSTSTGTVQSAVGFQPPFASEGKWEGLEFASGNYGLFESALAYSRDETAPSASLTVNGASSRTPVETTFKWDNEPSVIHYTLDGSEPTLASQTWEAQGPRRPGIVLRFDRTTTLKWIAKDIKGNVSGVKSARFVVDSDAPVTTASLAPAPRNDWYSAPIVTLTAQDGADGSGVARIEYRLDGGDWKLYSAPFAVTGDGARTLEYRAVDTLDNVEDARSTSFQVDGTKPTITISAPGASASYALDQAVTANFACADAGSGIESCTGTTADGAALDTSTVGTKQITVTAVDAAGNTRAVTRTYEVIWNRYAGFFQPVDNAKVNLAQAGSAIPVKFSLGANYGLAIFASGYPKVQQVNCSTSAPTDVIEQTVTAGGSSLTFENGQYVYIWKTQASWVGTCRQLVLKLRDNTVHTATFSFKS